MNLAFATGVKQRRWGGERDIKWKEEGTFSSPPLPLPLDACNEGYHNSIQMLFSATQVTTTPSKCYFHAENIQRLHSVSLIRKYGHLLRVCWAAPFWRETGSIFAILRHFSSYRMMSSTCVCLTWRLTTNKHGGPPAGILLSAIYKPFITLVCLLSSLFPYHWWQYLLLIVNLNEMQEKTYLKVVLLGKVNSGKTCLVTRYITRSFSEETPSVSTFFFSTIFIFF